MTGPGEGARARILGRIREALQGREILAHPGPLPVEVEPPWRQPDAAHTQREDGAGKAGDAGKVADAGEDSAVAELESGDGAPGSPEVLRAFAHSFRAAGGEVVFLADEDEALRWLARFCSAFETASVSPDVPMVLCPGLRGARPAEADLGVSVARGAAAQTGSLVLSSREGRGLQVLPPTHLVWVDPADVVATLGEALERQRVDLPAALALHSGPSKSADIGQIMVKGVHGPGRVVAAILG